MTANAVAAVASGCAICLEEDDTVNYIYHVQNGVPHVFHRACILEWLRINRSCPICREWVNPLTIATGTVVIVDDAYASKQLSDVHIPTTVNRIGARAFSDNRIARVWIPDSVRWIGPSAFVNNELRTVRLPAKLRDVPKCAFFQNRLTRVIAWPTRLKRIKEAAFFRNEFVEIDIPRSVVSIGDGAFACNALRRLELGEVRLIGRAAFAQNALEEVELPSSLVCVLACAFKENKLKRIRIPHTVLEVQSEAFFWNELERLSLSRGVTAIAERAFAYNRLRRVVIPCGVTVIRRGAFESNRLQSIALPQSLSIIEESAFCNNRLSGEMFVPDRVTYIGRNAFAMNPDLVCISLFNDVVVETRIADAHVEIKRRFVRGVVEPATVRPLVHSKNKHLE